MARANRNSVQEMLQVLSGWQPTFNLDKFSDVSTKSLETVTHLTEYQDEKANRILTAIAFISAFAGVLFTAVASHYSYSYLQELAKVAACRFMFFRSGYALFVLYALAVSCGAFLSVYGMRPTFNVPKDWKPEGTEPASFLFFEKITEVLPADWAGAFTRRTGPDDLVLRYTKHNIVETYLIAEKISTKLAMLRRANIMYIASMVILFLWVVVTGIAVASIDLFPSEAVSAIK